MGDAQVSPLSFYAIGPQAINPGVRGRALRFCFLIFLLFHWIHPFLGFPSMDLLVIPSVVFWISIVCGIRRGDSFHRWLRGYEPGESTDRAWLR